MTQEDKTPLIVINRPSLDGCRKMIAKRAIVLFAWIALTFWLCGVGVGLLWS